MPARIRSFWLPLGALVYVGFAAAEARGGYLPWIALALIPFGLGELFRRIRLGDGSLGPIETKAKQALAVTLYGTALWLLARTGPMGRPAFDAVANLATGLAAVAGLVALARMRAENGLLVPRPATASLDAAAFTAALWAIAVILPLARAVAPGSVHVDPLAIDYATTTAATGTLLVYVATSWRLRILRRYELGVGDRSAFAWALSIAVLLVAVPSAWLDVGPPDRVLPIAVLVGATALGWTATTPEPTRVATVLRGALALLLPGVPLLLIAGALARQFPPQSGTILLITLPLAMTLGLVARAVAKPLGPEQSRWLDAIDAASRGALEPEPDAAIKAALLALTRATHVVGSRPELWRADPPQVLSVDRAGYLHLENSKAPERLYELARGEPERTLRRETLDAVQIRQPEVRPILAWFDARRAFSATLVVDVDGPLGFLLLPRGNRTSPMTLEEARAVRLLADRMSALLAISSALARSREREIESQNRAETSEIEQRRLTTIVLRQAERNALIARSTEAELRRSTYSAQAQMSLAELTSTGQKDAHLLLECPPGVDAPAWLAVAHLASPRQGGPFVVVDGASGLTHAEEYWDNDNLSPLGLVDGGTLVVLDAPCLPSSIQDHLARWVSHQVVRAASAIRTPRLYLTVTQPAPAALKIEGGASALNPSLNRWFQPHHLVLPGLAERPEDLRALILGHLARFGMALGGRPLGVDEAALRELVEHSWPGNDLELRAVLLRASALASEATLSVQNLRAAGLLSSDDEATLGSRSETLPSEQPKARRRVSRTR